MLHWTVNLNGGPETKGHSFVAVKHKVYSFGAYNKDQVDVHVFNTVSLCWKKLQPGTTGGEERHLEVASIHYGHSAVLIEDLIYIWGGEHPYCNVLYAFDVDTHRWFKPCVSGTVPETRCYHSACVLEKVMYIHGGYAERLRTIANDMYKLDTSTMVWSLINTRGTPPPISATHSATIIGPRMFVFGGLGHNTIRVFDTETNCWLTNTPSAQFLPEGRSHQSAFAYNGELYIYGGDKGFRKHFNDLWKFSPVTFSWKKVESKGKHPCSRLSSRCSCMVGDRIHFGSFEPPDELYILDLSPSLKTLCKLAVIQCGLEQSGLPHDIRWELVGMTVNHTGQR